MGLSGHRSNRNKGVLGMAQRSSITAASDCLESYQDTRWGRLNPLSKYTWCILQAQPTVT